MPHWTTGEVRLLKTLHGSGMSRPQLEAKFPRHTGPAIAIMAFKLGVRFRRSPKGSRKEKKETRSDKWQRVAELHFARRAQGFLQ